LGSTPARRNGQRLDYRPKAQTIHHRPRMDDATRFCAGATRGVTLKWPEMARLRIVSINDVYSLENLPRMKSLVFHHAASDPADVMLVVLAGDFLAPSILSSLDAGRGMVECLNDIGVTHVVFGNHEDDVSIEELRKRVRELHATWLATNVHGFEPPLPASEVIDVAGVKVGLVGVVIEDETLYRRPPFGGAEVEPANAAALREAARLVEQGCASVVAITHQDLEGDRALARSGRFAAIVGGHEHDVHLETVQGTWLVKAGADAAHAVVTDLAWSGTGAPKVTARLDDAARYPEDARLRAIVDGHTKRVHELETATIVHLEKGTVLSSIGTRSRQTSMGTLVCSLVRDALEADACLFNGGGIRGAREYRGRVTYGDIKAEVPFDNEVVVARLPGAVVREAVTASRAHAPAEWGGFLQVDDRIAAPSDVVTHLDGAPLDEARTYKVAIVRDLFVGLDHIEPLMRFAREHPEAVPPAGSGREIKLVLVDACAVTLWEELGGFDAVDMNHDGRVTASEIATAVARATGDAPSAITAGLVIHAIDLDHDLAISPEEAAAAEHRGRRRAQ
jgi:2',3'-cyclic-nucleotide 2'-phosphodiesterase (5'-nucleotidase family)